MVHFRNVSVYTNLVLSVISLSYRASCSRVFDRWRSVASNFFLACTSLLGSFFRSCFHGYGINYLLPTIQQEPSLIFFSLCSTGLNLPASHSHSQGLAATPIVSVIQKSGRVDVYIKDAAHLYTFSLVWGNKREIRLTASLVSPICSLG